jgi:hypothetical protein
MPYYRYVAYSSNSKAEDLGSMEFRDDVEARAFGNQVIRDLIGTQAEHRGVLGDRRLLLAPAGGRQSVSVASDRNRQLFLLPPLSIRNEIARRL